MLPLLVGSTVGAIGGSTLVLANAPGLGAPWSGLALAAWVVLALGWMAATFLRRHAPADAPPQRHGLLVYGARAGAMLILIRVATTALDGMGEGHLRPAAIALAVGLHFLPFAWAFPMVSRLFRVLGLVVALLGGAGLVAGVLGVPVAGAAAAVVARLAMLALIAVHSLRGSSADAEIIACVGAGLPYLGSSPGSIVTGPSVEPASLMGAQTLVIDDGGRWFVASP
ncbi:hypothetical protein ACFYE2_06620 [Kocuria sp. CPCC 205300]|uniref:hypothetical protein n=1 Tax=Kocuria sabuli TaxID=3071448 RepID=UPI0036DEB6D6